jgi:alpha-D-ribose 1-methylphosphonate 5-triphosphate synthase subunit PhnG
MEPARDAPMTRPMTHEVALGVLCRADTNHLKALADEVLPELLSIGSLEVVQNRTGLVMLPYRDTVHGTPFFLGEVLVAEGHVRFTPHQGTRLEARAVEGYGAILGRDLEAALSVALIDLSMQLGVNASSVTVFLEHHKTVQDAQDDVLWRKVESTRVQMETF